MKVECLLLSAIMIVETGLINSREYQGKKIFVDYSIY